MVNRTNPINYAIGALRIVGKRQRLSARSSTSFSAATAHLAQLHREFCPDDRPRLPGDGLSNARWVPAGSSPSASPSTPPSRKRLASALEDLSPPPPRRSERPGRTLKEFLVTPPTPLCRSTSTDEEAIEGKLDVLIASFTKLNEDFAQTLQMIAQPTVNSNDKQHIMDIRDPALLEDLLLVSGAECYEQVRAFAVQLFAESHPSRDFVQDPVSPLAMLRHLMEDLDSHAIIRVKSLARSLL
eukprot:UN0645